MEHQARRPPVDGLAARFLCDYDVAIAGPDTVPGPYGTRLIYRARGGRAEGPALSGEILPGGGDWMLVPRDGAARLDVRITIRTDDGALVFCHYPGIADLSAEAYARLQSGHDVGPDEIYLRTTPWFETGDERYAWLNKVVCVAVGWLGPMRVGYRVFQIL